MTALQEARYAGVRAVSYDGRTITYGSDVELAFAIEKTSLLDNVFEALRDHGIGAAITALVGGTIALLASITRKALTNDAMFARLDRELTAERDRVDRRRAEDRLADADRLARIESDVRAMRDLMFEAFQRYPES